MKRILLWSLAVALLLYSAAWFILSKVIESEVYSQLAKLKKDRVIEEYSGDVEVSGFPFSFNIKFVHPRIKFKQGVSGDALFDGVLTVNLALFSSKVTADLNGDLHLKMLANGQSFDLATNSKEFSLGAQLQDTLIFTAIKLATSDDFKELPIRGGYLSLEDFSLTNKSTNKTLLYSEEMDLRLKLNGTRDDSSIKLYEKVKNTEFQAEFNTLSSAIRSIPLVRNALNQMSSNARNYFDVFSPDKFGKINHEMDLTCEMNKNGNKLIIDKFNLQDELHKADLSGKFSFGESTKIDGNFSGKFSQRWYTLAQIYADRLDLRDIFPASHRNNRNQSIFSDIFAAIVGFTRNAFLSGNRAAYVPKLHEMGTIKSDANMTYTGTPDGFYIEAKKININTQAFAVQMNGTVHSSARSRGDTYDLKAKLHNYPYIIETAVNYVNRVSRNMRHSFFLAGKQLTLSQAMADKLKLFMLELSDNPQTSTNDLNLTIINKDGGKYPQVGNYSSQEFARAWNNFVFKIIFMEIADKLNPETLSKLLKNPLDFPKGLGETAKNITEGLMNIFRK